VNSFLLITTVFVSRRLTPMARIVLTAEQASVLEGACEPVAICRRDGSIAGFVSPKGRLFTPDICPFTPEEIAAAEKEGESPGPWYTTKEVLEHLRSLDQARP
jgi:hypothetical protein